MRALAGVLVLAACGGSPASAPDLAAPMCDESTAPASGDLPCDVAAVLAARCWPCHQQPPKNHAPFSELSYEDLMKQFGQTGLVRWQRMAQVIEPMSFPHMPPNGQPQLDDADFATLRAWFAACAPPRAEAAGCDGQDAGFDAGGATP